MRGWKNNCVICDTFIDLLRVDLVMRWCLHSTSIDEIEFEFFSLGKKSDGTKSEMAFKIIVEQIMKLKSKDGSNYSLLAYNDRHGWGKEIVSTLRGLSGLELTLFKSTEDLVDCTGTIVFMHPDHLNNRDSDKALIHDLGLLEKTKIIPSFRELDIYDEKVKQTNLFDKWLPKTRIFTERGSAEIFIENAIFPFVSKANEGAGSSNVRMILTEKDAHEELNQVFSENGMPRYTKPSMEKRGVRKFQKDYVLWQEFLEGNENDWRVVMINRQFAWIIKRGNRGDSPFASGSGIVDNIVDLDRETTEILDFCFKFASQFSLNFTGIDIVKGENGSWRILETTTGWGQGAFQSRVFVRMEDGNWHPTIFKGKDQWKIASLAVISQL